MAVNTLKLGKTRSQTPISQDATQSRLYQRKPHEEVGGPSPKDGWDRLQGENVSIEGQRSQSFLPIPSRSPALADRDGLA